MPASIRSGPRWPFVALVAATLVEGLNGAIYAANGTDDRWAWPNAALTLLGFLLFILGIIGAFRSLGPTWRELRRSYDLPRDQGRRLARVIWKPASEALPEDRSTIPVLREAYRSGFWVMLVWITLIFCGSVVRAVTGPKPRHPLVFTISVGFWAGAVLFTAFGLRRIVRVQLADEGSRSIGDSSG